MSATVNKKHSFTKYKPGTVKQRKGNTILLGDLNSVITNITKTEAELKK